MKGWRQYFSFVLKSLYSYSMAVLILQVSNDKAEPVGNIVITLHTLNNTLFLQL